MDETQREVKAEPMPESGVPKDVRVELPFPYLVATFDGRFAIAARVVDNQFADIAIIDMGLPPGHEMFGKPVASVRVAFGPTPIDTEVGAYWTNAIATTANSLYAAFCQKQAQAIALPQKPALVGLNGGKFVRAS